MNLIYYDLYQATRLEKFVTGILVIRGCLIFLSLSFFCQYSDESSNLQLMDSFSKLTVNNLLLGNELPRWWMFSERPIW